MKESDPTGRKPSDPGAKLDHGKPDASLLLDFGNALLAVADVGTFGAAKYSRGGWSDVPNGEIRYTAAQLRHMLKSRFEYRDPDSQCTHLAQDAWNALAKLELHIRKRDGISLLPYSED